MSVLRGLQNAASGLRAQQLKIDVIAHNIANVNTYGFRNKTAVFQDLVYQSMEKKGIAVMPAPAASARVSAGSGSSVATVRSDQRAGNYLQTGRNLDLALAGEGYFHVLLPGGGDAYTRDGNFRFDGEGNVVTALGYRVVFPELPAGENRLEIDLNGAVTVINGEGEAILAGQLELAYFNNPHGLEQLGDNLLVATQAAGEVSYGAPVQGVEVIQGFLESSNVDLSEEMVRLVISGRAFELNSRALRTADEMWSIANQMRR
jgi:flagellar basal-body rod protein FlgG